MSSGSKDVKERMQELGVYDLYGFRPETKALAAVLRPFEVINCVATGMHDGRKKMLAATDQRILLVCASLGTQPEFLAFDRKAVSSYKANKRFFTSSLVFTVHGQTIELTMVSRRVPDLFAWAMEQAPTVFDT